MKVYLRTLGCRANQYDAEGIRAMVESGGHQTVADASAADIAIFNSCAVTSGAEAELRKLVRAAARSNSRLVSIVTGCAAALPDEGRPIAARLRGLPSVEHVIGGADLTELAKALGVPHQVSSIASHQSTTRALLRIQDGCDEHCTFCATTMARGANRSRSIRELVGEAQLLAEHHPEIVLTGIHIGTYGQDIGTTLAALLERLVAETSRVRFRLSSIEATEVDERLTELVAGSVSRVTPHLHAPLQSGSDRVLRRMGRHWYTSRSYAHAVERLAAAARVLGLGADLIAGFPGEEEADHRATLSLVRQLPFTYLHVFPFSRRPGTPADRLDDHLPPLTVQARARELRQLGAEKAQAHILRRVSQVADVIVVSVDESGRHGLTEDFLDVFVEGPRARGDRFVARLESRPPNRLAAPAA